MGTGKPAASCGEMEATRLVADDVKSKHWHRCPSSGPSVVLVEVCLNRAFVAARSLLCRCWVLGTSEPVAFELSAGSTYQNDLPTRRPYDLRPSARVSCYSCNLPVDLRACGDLRAKCMDHFPCNTAVDEWTCGTPQTRLLAC